MIDIDSYLARRFNIWDYNCWHLVRDAWRDITGRDIGDRTPAVITKAALRDTFTTDVPTFTSHDKPVEPCIVLMQNPPAVPHVGIYTGGKVLQITEKGVSYLPIAQACAGYGKIGFYSDGYCSDNREPA